MSRFISIFAFLAMFAVSLNAQTWTWRRIDTPTAPDARRYGTAVHDSTLNRIIVFGGLGNSGFLNDTWAFDLSSESWSRLNTNGPAPDPRFGHNAVYDPAGNQMVVWAGQQGSRFFNDTFTLNLTTLTWTNVTPANRPRARYGSAAIYDPVSRSLVQFAGFTQESSRFNDTQAFSLSSNTWQDWTPRGVLPQVRCLHTAAFDPDGRRMIVYGGQRVGALDDLWSFDLQSRSWTQLTPPDRPSGRFFSSSFVGANGHFFLVGGTAGGGNSAEVWEFDPGAGRWQLTQVAGAFPARSAMMGAFSPSARAFVAFGGTGDTGLLNDTWILSDTAGPSAVSLPIPAGGSAAWSPDASSSTLRYGYALATDAVGASGSAVVRYKNGGITTSVTSIDGAPFLADGVMFVEDSGSIRTEVSFVNPSRTAINIGIDFTDLQGRKVFSTAISLAARAQLHRWITEAPLNAPPGFRGTLVFTATDGIAAAVLRRQVNDRADSILTSLPIATATRSNGPVTIPHYASGDGWSTTVVLVNPYDHEVSGTVSVRAPDGTQVATTDFVIPARSAQAGLAMIPGRPGSGSIQVTPEVPSQVPMAFAMVSLEREGFLVSTVAIEGRASSQATRVFLERDASSSIHTALAIANTNDTEIRVDFEVFSADGVAAGHTGSLTVRARGQIGAHVQQLAGLESIPAAFSGSIRVTSSAPIAIAALQSLINERQDYIVHTVPMYDENGSRIEADLTFPLLALGAGYATRVSLVSGGRSANPRLQLYLDTEPR